MSIVETLAPFSGFGSGSRWHLRFSYFKLVSTVKIQPATNEVFNDPGASTGRSGGAFDFWRAASNIEIRCFRLSVRFILSCSICSEPCLVELVLFAFTSRFLQLLRPFGRRGVETGLISIGDLCLG